MSGIPYGGEFIKLQQQTTYHGPPSGSEARALLRKFESLAQRGLGSSADLEHQTLSTSAQGPRRSAAAPIQAGCRARPAGSTLSGSAVP